MPGLDYILYQCPWIQLDVYMDDLAETVTGSTTELSDPTVRATDTMLHIIRDRDVGFGADLAVEKAEIVTSSRAALVDICARLGPLATAGKYRNAAINLGIDFRPGLSRRRLRGSKRIDRLVSARRRMRRVRIVAGRMRRGRSRVSRIHMTGTRH